MRMTKNYEHVMCILNVTEGDGLHNHSCYIAYKRKEKNVTGFVLLCVNIAHYHICQKNPINWQHIKQKFSVLIVDTEIKGLK